mgnify:CR=1 FL=1
MSRLLGGLPCGLGGRDGFNADYKSATNSGGGISYQAAAYRLKYLWEEEEDRGDSPSLISQ